MRKKGISISVSSESAVAEILTDRMYLRLYQGADFKDALELYSDEKLTRLFDSGKPLSYEEVKNLMDERAYAFSKKGIPLGIFSAFCNSTKKFIGHFDILPTENPGIVEAGCILKREFHCKEFALEGIKALVFDYVNAFNSNGFHVQGLPIRKVIASTHPKNFPSIAIIESIGMVKEKESTRFGKPRIWYYCDVKPQTNGCFCIDKVGQKKLEKTVFGQKSRANTRSSTSKSSVYAEPLAK